MCNAFSFVVHRNGKVYWKFGIDSHSDIIEKFGLSEKNTCLAEIIPKKDKDYLGALKPSEKYWKFSFDEKNKELWHQECPEWWKASHEKHSWEAFRQWFKELDKILIRKKIIHPFKNIKPPKRITRKHIELLKQWASVWDSVGASVWASVWDSVGASVGDSVGASVWVSVWDSVGASVGDSVWASVWVSVRDSVYGYAGSFFRIKKWKYIKHKPYEYPFESVVKLWEQGLVPVFDGEKWMLLGGKKAEVLFEIEAKELKKFSKGEALRKQEALRKAEGKGEVKG